MASEADLRAIALSLPEVDERSSYGNRPSWKVRGRGFVGIWKDEASAVITIEDLAVRHGMLENEPEKFFTTSHYGDGPRLLVRLERVNVAELRELVTDSWRAYAPEDVVAAFDANS